MDSVDPAAPRSRRDAAPRGDIGLLVAAAALLALAALTVGLPGAEVAAGIARRLLSPQAQEPIPGVSAGAALLLATTIAHPALIAAVATALAWPVAWAVGRAGRAGRRLAIAAACAVPLLLPNYLAYAALNLLRAPRTAIGDFLAEQEPWASIAFGKAIALLGLALWAWPIALLALAPAVQRLPRDTLDALELDGAGRLWPLRRTLLLASMLRGPIALAILAVGVVMLGSAVPLHVAQIDTFATRLWLRLSLTTDPAAAWIGAWPLLVIAALAAAGACSRLGRGAHDTGNQGPSHPPARRALPSTVGACAVLAISVLLPLAMFISSLREPGAPWSLRTALGMSAAFWRDARDAVAASAGAAAATGLLAALIAALSWCALSAPGHRRPGARIALVCVGLWIVAGLTPGVLVGSALARAWTSGIAAPLDAILGGRIGDTPAILVLAHGARFGIVAALVGWWLAALEPREEREMRLLDGATGARAWLLARVGPAGVGAVLGAGVAAAALSFHEIEAAVMVQPPGLASFPQQVLEDLHFARDARLGAAAVNLLAAGIVLSGTAGWLILRAGARERRSSSPATPETGASFWLW